MAKLRIKLNTDVAEEVLPRKLSKSEVRQLQIIENSIRLCARHGIEALSYGRIAEECGVTRHLVIHYFPSRDDIIERAMEYVWATLKLEILGAMDRETKAVAKMKAYVSSNLAWGKKHRDLLVFLSLFHHYAASKASFRELNSQLMLLGRNRVLGILELGIAQKEFSNISKLEYEAKCIQLSVTGHLMNLVTENASLDLDDMEKHLIETILNRISLKKS